MPDGSASNKTEDLSTLPNVNSKATFIDELKTNGYCIVPAVIPQERVDRYIDDALTWLEEFGHGFNRDDKRTWRDDTLPISAKGGLYNRYAVGHEDWVWRARCEPGVIKAFEELWGTNELIVSFDGMNVTFPYGEHGRTDIELTPPWPHQDQNPHKPEFQLAQGIIAISESGPEDGGLVVLSKSHLMHQDFYAANGGINEAQRNGRLNSYLFTNEQADWYRKNGATEVKVCCPAGSVIIWDSRLIHWNRMPTGSRTRIATYACYAPRAFADEEALKRKAEVYQSRHCTTHWPATNDVPLLQFGPPQRDGKPDPWHRSRPQHEPIENDTLLRLAGVKSY